MATKTKTTATKKVKKSVATKNTSQPVRADNGARLRPLNKRQRTKQVKLVERALKLPSVWVLLGRSLRHLYRHKKLFLGILLVYGVLYVLFVKGISANFQLGNLRASLDETFSGELNGFGTGVALFGLLLGSAGTAANEVGGAYQTALVVIISLALIWALRNTFNPQNIKLRIRDSFYQGMYPLVPFILVCLVLVVQSLPALITSSIYSVVQSNGLAVGTLQQGIALAVLLSGILWTFYLLSSSLFALYIVTLVDTPPMAALKSARKLVKFKRKAILRKVIFLPIILLLFSAIILIPLIILVPFAAELLFMIFTILLLGVVHSYLYTLYRSLL